MSLGRLARVHGLGRLADELPACVWALGVSTLRCFVGRFARWARAGHVGLATDCLGNRRTLYFPMAGRPHVSRAWQDARREGFDAAGDLAASGRTCLAVLLSSSVRHRNKCYVENKCELNVPVRTLSFGVTVRAKWRAPIPQFMEIWNTDIASSAPQMHEASGRGPN